MSNRAPWSCLYFQQFDLSSLQKKKNMQQWEDKKDVQDRKKSNSKHEITEEDEEDKEQMFNSLHFPEL